MNGARNRSAYFSFGNVAIDDLVFADGTTRWGVHGGGAIYAALGMALWTGVAAVVAPIGPDYDREQFSTIDFSQSPAIAHTMRNWGLYETDGSRHFLSRRDSLPWDAFSSSVRELDAGPYPFCHVAPMPWARLRELVDALSIRGARTISLDLHDRELAAITPAELASLLERVQIFLPSRQDTDILVPGSTPLTALRALRAKLPRLAVIGVKCGADGALVHAAGSADIVVVPPVRVPVVDVTGAGDAFCGGFLAGYAERADAVQAALWGTVSASFALAAPGPSAFGSVERGEPAARVATLRPALRSVPFAG
jgi:sugar/nucleoside kinase (ribokinase family)